MARGERDRATRLPPTASPHPSSHQAARDPASGEVGFNVELGGYFSIKRNVMSIRCASLAVA